MLKHCLKQSIAVAEVILGAFFATFTPVRLATSDYPVYCFGQQQE